MPSTKKYTSQWFTSRFAYAKKRAQQIESQHNRDQLTRRPAPDRWSAAECIAHLNEFGSIYYDTIQRGVEQARTDESVAGNVFKPRLFWRGVIRIFEPPYRMKLKTIGIFEPDQLGSDTQEDAFANFHDLQDRFIDQIERCRQKGIDLSNIKVSNPALQFLKMTLAECFAVADAHQRRHLWQAEQTLQNLSEG